MTDKEKTIKELKEALDSLDITNKYRLNLIRAIEYLQEEPVSEELEDAAYKFVMDNFGNPKEPLYKFDQRCFKAGAQWQKERMLIKACEFIRTPNIYVVDINRCGGATTNYDATVDKFKKYMEGC